MELLLQTFWLLLPAGVANMSPVLVKWLPFLDFPVDLGKKFYGRPLFGKNKTYRGVVFGTLAAIITVYLQEIFYPQTKSLAIIDYSENNLFLLGFLLGFGALFGDLIESFFKRQLGIAPGRPFFPFDQIDWVLGALLFVSCYISVPLKLILLSIVLFGLLHPLINLLGYFLGIKKNKF